MKTTLRGEALELRSKYDEEPSHSDHVAELAGQLFAALAPWHRLDAHQRELLDCAAILHDIGWSQTSDGTGHHKHSARLIQAHSWDNLAPDEVAVVAQIARYHRKALPKSDHKEFQALSAATQKRVLILGGILRLADALDRTHTGRIVRIEAKITEDALLVRVQPRESWDAERAMFENKRDMLELASGRSIRCEAV